MDLAFYKQYFETEKGHWLMKVRRMIARDVLSRYLHRRIDGVKVLDFGCGSGIFAEELAEKGYDSYGVDISKEAISFGKSQGIKNLEVFDSHTLNFPDNTFDAVVILDVLEHLEDEAWALKEMERVLKPGGNVVVMVPAFMFLWGVQDEASHHYRRYTKTNLLKKIRNSSDFTVLRASYFNTFLFLPIAFVRIFSRFFGTTKRKSDFDLNNKLINRIFFALFNTERKLLKHTNFPFGVSILAVLKKPKDKII